MGVGVSSGIPAVNDCNLDRDVIGLINTIKIGHTWTVNNFRNICKNKSIGQSLASPIFLSDYKNRYKWRLIMYPLGEDINSAEFVSIYLQLESTNDDSDRAIKCSFTMSIINAAGEQVNTHAPKLKHCFVKGKTLWGYSKFIERKILLEENCKLLHGPSKGGRLVIFCENTDISTTSYVSPDCKLLQVSIIDSFNKMSNDFESLLQNHSSSDLTILGSSGKAYYVHKIILGARSPVFAAMFEHKMKENNENILIIEDVRQEVLWEMLRFIYSNRVHDLEGMVFELLPVAEKYQLTDLKKICEERLMMMLTVNNAIELLIFADLYNATMLKNCITEFIIDQSKAVADTNDFKTAMKTHPVLIAEIFEKMVQK